MFFDYSFCYPYSIISCFTHGPGECVIIYVIEKNRRTILEKDRKTYIIEGILCLLLLIFTVGAVIGLGIFYKISHRESGDMEHYSARYAFVSVNDDEFARSVYEYAVIEASRHGAYIEKIGDNLLNDYTVEELMRIAVDTAPDAIIVENSESKDIYNMIDEAEDKGIVVITYMTDAHASKRSCFVGPNYYDIGKKYGEEIESLKKTEKCNIRILYNSEMSEININNINAGMLAVLNKEKMYHVDSVSVSGNTPFEVEQNVRDSILHDSDGVNIIICLDENITNSVTQTMVDFNMVGSKDVLGYYNSESIIDSISNGVLYASITTDSKAIAENCIRAIDEAITTGYVSSYIYSPIIVIDGNNVAEYEREMDEEKSE